MGVVNNLCTPKNGEILVAATQDFLTSAYLITSRDRFLSRQQVSQFLAYMSDNRQVVELPPPAIVRPLELWTGKQLFSMLLRPSSRVGLFINLETAEKIYTKQGEHMCPMDGYVAFRNSELLCGRLGKATLGGGNKAGLFQVIMTDYSAAAAAAAMQRLSKLSARFIGDTGFSIGIDDVTPAESLRRAKAATLDAGYGQCDDFIAAYDKGELTPQPGCNAEESLEASVTGVLNNIREQAAKARLECVRMARAGRGAPSLAGGQLSPVGGVPVRSVRSRQCKGPPLLSAHPGARGKVSHTRVHLLSGAPRS